MRTHDISKEAPSANQRRHLRKLVLKRLMTIQAQITELTLRTPPLPDKIQFYDDEKLTSPTFCGSFKPHELRLAHQLFNRSLLLEAVLYREMYSSLLPQVVRAVPESGDLGLLCGYQHMDKAKQEQFLKLWPVVSPRRYFGDVVYNAPIAFPLFNQVTQATFLRRILPYFDELEPAITPLSTREYVELIETFMLNYASPLTEQELRVLHLIQENPTATLKQLQKLCSLSLGGLSKYVTGFREKLLLSRFYRIDYPRLRLNHVAVLAYPAPGSHINRFVEQCPYLRKIHRFGGVGAPFLLSYLLPRLRLRRLQEWLQELVGLGHLLRYRFYPLTGIFNGYNLRSYLAHSSDVPIAERFRWVAWTRYLRDVLIREGYGEILEQPHVYEYSKSTIDPVILDPLDYQLLPHITPESTAEDLSQLFGESIHVIRRRQRELFKKHVFFERPDLSLFHLGLNETLFIILEAGDQIVQNFLAGCREAPMYGGSVFKHPTPGCIVAFGLPTGLALRVGRELGRLFLEQSEFDAAVFYGNGSKDFMVNPVLKRCHFDTELSQWVWHREYFPTAYDHVDSYSREVEIPEGSHFSN